MVASELNQSCGDQPACCPFANDVILLNVAGDVADERSFINVFPLVLSALTANFNGASPDC